MATKRVTLTEPVFRGGLYRAGETIEVGADETGPWKDAEPAMPAAKGAKPAAKGAKPAAGGPVDPVDPDALV